MSNNNNNVDDDDKPIMSKPSIRICNGHDEDEDNGDRYSSRRIIVQANSGNDEDDDANDVESSAAEQTSIDVITTDGDTKRTGTKNESTSSSMSTSSSSAACQTRSNSCTSSNTMVQNNTSSMRDNKNSGNTKGTTTTLLKMLSEAKENYSLYDQYELEIDMKQGNKAVEVVLCNFSRPHMRSFHFSWMCFFVGYLMWFGLAPLINSVSFTLNLSTEDIWTSHITSIGGALFLRLFSGPMCDQWGARLTMGLTLIVASIPTALTGLAQGAISLSVLRFFTGFAGSTFVACQYWTSTMFTKEVAGTANAIVAGWGNVGGGVAPLLMGSVLFPLMKSMGLTPCQAWRTVCVVPAVLSFIMGILCIKYTDDAPKGNYKQLKRHGVMSNETSPTSNLWIAAYNRNTWMLFIQYAMCLGVELTMNNATVMYFMDKHDMSTEQAGAVASLFGFMNLFARGLGGYASDWANLRKGLRGRLIVQTVLLLGEGVSVWFFVHIKSLGGAIGLLIIFSLFVQAAEGSTYGILPYVNPHVTGSIAGIVGAGGNVGAILFGVCFQRYHDHHYHWAFMLMAVSIWISCFCSLFIRIPGLAGLCCGHDCEEAILERKARHQQTTLIRNVSQHGITNTSNSNTSSKAIQQAVEDDFHPSPNNRKTVVNNDEEAQ